MSDIKLIDITEDSDTYYCRVYHVEYEGKSYTLEEWSTDSAGGVEVYDENGNHLTDNDPLPDDALEQIQPLIDAYSARITAEVDPIVARIKQEVFGG